MLSSSKVVHLTCLLIFKGKLSAVSVFIKLSRKLVIRLRAVFPAWIQLLCRFKFSLDFQVYFISYGINYKFHFLDIKHSYMLTVTLHCASRNWNTYLTAQPLFTVASHIRLTVNWNGSIKKIAHLSVGAALLNSRPSEIFK